MKKTIIIVLLPLLLFTLGCSSDDDTSKTEDTVSPFAGNFRGTWTSQTANNNYDRIPASIKFVADANDETKFTGQFYYTASFTTCCQSGANDGTVQMTVRDNEIINFKLNSIVPNCSGIFEGTGTLENETITINFGGGDCEGPHSGGQLVFNL